jgi:hypothetical protein
LRSRAISSSRSLWLCCWPCQKKKLRIRLATSSIEGGTWLIIQMLQLLPLNIL